VSRSDRGPRDRLLEAFRDRRAARLRYRWTASIATSAKDAVRHLDTYFAALSRLSYPAEHLSLGFVEGDSADGTHAALKARLPELQRQYPRARLWKRDFREIGPIKGATGDADAPFRVASTEEDRRPPAGRWGQ
jgi:hypothetical protein